MLTLSLITFWSDKCRFECYFTTCLNPLNSLSLNFCISKAGQLHHYYLGLLQRLNEIGFEKGLTEHLKIYQVIRKCSATKSCSTLYDPMDRSMPGFPAHHCLLELAQVHVHLVGDAI